MSSRKFRPWQLIFSTILLFWCLGEAQVLLGQAEVPVPDTHFAVGRDCALCHSNSFRAVAMRDSQQRGIAPYDLWQSSMMANSSKDPFWKAVLSAEVQATPNLKSTIEEKCTRCHAPMAGSDRSSPEGEVVAFLNGDHKQAVLGRDGVSCTVCHQIDDVDLGEESSFTGHFHLNTESKIFGPHRNPVTMPMQRHVGFTPTFGEHILESSMCATCHTLLTTSVDGEGKPTVPGSHGDGNFHEQAPYLEWRNSVFNTEGDSAGAEARSCQSCHLPTVDEDGQPIATRLAHNPGGRDFPFLGDRQPFGRHTLIGSNTLMTRILRDNAEDLGVTATTKSFEASLKAMKSFLENQTARLELGAPRQQSGQVILPVTIQNLAGHKLPTAYPSRRMWIQLEVTDEAGQTVFHSGNFNDEGQLVDQQAQVLASEKTGGPILPHQSVISSASTPQVYESIMADAAGQPTFTLLRAAEFVKDNRILPQGWSDEDAYAATLGPRGIQADPNFVGGSDTVDYQLELPPGQYTATATLRFQVIAPRHAAELFLHSTKEVKQFQEFYEAADRRPETLQQTELKFKVDPPR